MIVLYEFDVLTGDSGYMDLVEENGTGLSRSLQSLILNVRPYQKNIASAVRCVHNISRGFRQCSWSVTSVCCLCLESV